MTGGQGRGDRPRAVASFARAWNSAAQALRRQPGLTRRAADARLNDRAVHIGLILTELVINANKYAYAGGAGPITIALEQQRTRFSLIVSDRGGGKSGRSSGFGSRMLVSLVARLAGTIEESDNRPGLRVTIVAPISEA